MERILDAAAHVFARTGYEAATTEAIAEQAGASIGSLYQFFPNKEALFSAIAARYLEKTRVIFERLFADRRIQSWRRLLDESIDAFAALDRDDMDFRAVWTNWHLSREFLAAGQALNREFAKRTEAVLAREARGLPPSRRELVASVVVEAISAMLFFAARSDDATGRKIVEETKTLLRRYLAPYAK